ncbi:MAG: metal-sensing transcriptional repressor [Lachnospiraceae bacterium]|nr:metal-sensing transcriptional repressor [Lachnospiraceae bacterium]
MDNTCCHTKKLRGEEEKRNLMNRLKRIEGQVRGLQNMLEQDAYCPDILIQVSAVTQALNSFNKELLAEHIRSCVVEDIRADRTETVDELVETLKKVMR